LVRLLPSPLGHNPIKVGTTTALSISPSDKSIGIPPGSPDFSIRLIEILNCTFDPKWL
jgi:hypothetical protein